MATINIGDALRPHSKALAIALAAVVGEGVAELLQPWPLKIVFDDVLQSETPHHHGCLAHWLVSLTSGDPLTTLKVAAIAGLLIAAVGGFCSYIERYLTMSVSQWIMHELRRSLYSHIQRLSLSYHDHKQTGDLISRVTGDVDAIQSFIATGLLGSLMNILTLVGMVGMMFYINWRFTLVALSIVPPLFGVAYSYTRRIKKAAREVRQKEGEIVSVIQEVLTSIRVVKAFAREEFEQHRLEEESLEGVEIALRARGLKAKLSPLVEIIVAVGTSMVLWFGAHAVLGNTLSAGSLIVFVFYLGKMYKPMRDLSKITDTYSRAVVGYERIREIMETNHEVRDLPGARPAPQFRGNIQFDRVVFSYEPGSPVLRGVTFAIEAGQTAALVGRTGAGKTTIISLLPRFYDLDSGAIKIDGRDIRTITLATLRCQISFVLQDTILFHGPLWYNIAYGKPGASRPEILAAARLANVDEFVGKLPDGYDTVVGERGVTLSGGQRQRVAIARAVIRNNPILILDEPSTGLDAGSEQVVFEALDRLMEGKTSIVSAHRLSTIRRADIILVVKNGTIVEQGRHEQLCKSGGPYTQLYELQSHDTETVVSL